MSLKPRQALTTVLALGEGETEQAFLKHLKSIYNTRGCGVTIKIGSTYGGSPVDMVDEAIRRKKLAAYTRSFLLLDTDVPCPEGVIASAHREQLELVFSAPCIEGLFLEILAPGTNWASRSTADCKRQFHQNYIPEDQKTDERYYIPIFTKAVLDGARTSVTRLDRLIELLTSI